MRVTVLRQMCRWTAMALVSVVAAACSKGETAQARGRDAAAQAVTVEIVKKERTVRAVDLVGTLAAVDQGTISSGTEGEVSRILADLGDRVQAGAPPTPGRSAQA